MIDNYKLYVKKLSTNVVPSVVSFIMFLSFSTPTWSMQSAIQPEGVKHVTVAVLGGGMAGLTAAYELHKKGVRVELFEGRNRLGGRTNTHYFNNDHTQYFEEGGTDIDDDHKATIALAAELRVPLTKRGYGSGKISIFDQQHPVPLATFEKQLGTLENFFTQRDKEFMAHGNYAEYDQFDKVHYRPLLQIVSQSSLSPQARGFLKTFYESEIGVPVDKGVVYHIKWLQEEMKQYHSLLWYRNSRFVPNSAISMMGYKFRVTQGISQLVDRLRQEIEKTSTINIAYKLTRMSREGNGYVLTFESGNGPEKSIKTVFAFQVIMTLPFSTLRHVTIDPSIKLPELTMKAIQTLPYGTNGKIGMRANGDKNLADEMLYYVNVTSPLIAWPGQRALTFYVSAQAGSQLTANSAQQIIGDNLPNIQREYPGFQFDTPIVKNWAEDEFARGSYSAVTTDMEADLANPSTKYPEAKMFADPLDSDALIFGGEHTRADRTQGNIEGAVLSGLLASKITLQRMRRQP